MPDQTPPAAAAPLQPEPPEPPSAKRSRWMLWTGLGCGGFVLMVVMCAGGFGRGGWSVRAQAEPVVNKFLADIERKDYAAAWNSTGDEWRLYQKEEAFIEFERRQREIHGTLTSKTFQSLTLRKTSRANMATLVYSATFANGPGKLTMTLLDSRDGWRVVGHAVDSDLLHETSKCPHCGEPCDLVARLCRSCGKPLHTPEPPPD